MKFTRIILLAIATLVLALFAPAPAQASQAGNITHLAPDEGYDRAFSVTCWGGGVVQVAEGQTSRCQNGTTSIYVWDGQEIHCVYTSPNGTVVWVKAADATGSYDMANFISLKCKSVAD